MIIEITAALLLVACLLPGLLLRYVPFESIADKKSRRILLIVYAGLCIADIVTVTVGMELVGVDFAFNHLRFGGIIFSTVTTLVNAAILRGRFREHLFVYGIVLNCSYLLMSIPNYLTTLVHLPSHTAYLFFVVIIYLVLLWTVYFPLRNLLRYTISPFLLLDTGRYWNTIWFIPIAYFGAKYIALGGEHNSGSLGQLTSSILYGAIIVLTCMSIAADHKSMSGKLMIEQQLAEQKVHYAEMQTTVQDARRTRHDMKHHIEAIRRFIATDDKAGLSVYCDDLFRENELDRATIPYTGNVAVDGIVYRYLQLCEAESIEFTYSGTVKNNGVSDMDVCILIGNALDNAYNACLTVPEGRYIKLICKSEPQLLTIIIRNGFDGRIEQKDDGTLISRKRGDRPGVGMASMDTVCKRLGGNIEKSWDESTFNLMIMIPLSKNE